MLQFWKKSSQKEKANLPSPSKCFNGNVLPTGVTVSHYAELNCVGPLHNFQYIEDGKVPVEHSRLSLSFSEMIQDKLAFSYFSQFMEVRGYAVLLNLWLDIQQLCSNCTPVPSSSREEYSKVSSVFKKSCGRSSSSDRSERDSNSRMGGRTIRGRCSSDSGERTSTVSAIVQKIWQRYLSDNATFYVKVPDELRSNFYEDLTNEDNGGSFQQLYDYVFQYMKKDLWNDFMHSEWLCKYQVEVLTSGTVELSDIIYHPSALTCFTEFLDQEGYLSVLEFWQMAKSFEKNLLQAGDSFDAVQAQNDAVLIYDKYLSLQATNPLGIDHATRCEVEQGICMESCAPRPDCFRPALRIAWAYLSVVCLPVFLSSQNYVQLLSELMRASRNTNSPASSVTDISIESRTKHDPDMIWRRRHHNRDLSIGRIDQLGRFETNIEPEPDKKSESRISRVVKKLVNKDEYKAQEEMAWRVAEMIIKDVTNLTMGSNLDEDDDT